MYYKLGSFVKLPTKTERVGLVMCHSMGHNCIEEIDLKTGEFKKQKAGSYYGDGAVSWGNPEYLDTPPKLNPFVWYNLKHNHLDIPNGFSMREHLVKTGALEKGKFPDYFHIKHYGDECYVFELLLDGTIKVHPTDYKLGYLLHCDSELKLLGKFIIPYKWLNLREDQLYEKL